MSDEPVAPDEEEPEELDPEEFGDGGEEE